MDVEKSLRKTSLIYHYGIGGLWTNKFDETFIIKSPNFWTWKSDRREVGRINEEHLKDYLGVNNILFPPGGKDKQIPFIKGDIGMGRFPGWHRCKGWRTVSNDKKERCGAMYLLSQTDSLALCTNPNCTGNKKSKSLPESKLAPVRFMKICSNGHLDDFPFHQWVHNGSGYETHKLRYINKSGSGLSGIYIQCETCSSEASKKERSMSGALTPDNFDNYVCSGRTPWKDDIREDCAKESTNENGKIKTKQVGVQKSSSNLLFPIVRNAIFCPTSDGLPAWIKNQLEYEGNKSKIQQLLQTTSMDLSAILHLFFSDRGEEKFKEILVHIDEIQNYLAPKTSIDSFRENGYLGIMQREYDRFLNFPEAEKLDDFTVNRPDMGTYSDEISSFVDKVVLIDKLRDTRVYIGFTRLEPQNNDDIKISEIIKKCYGTNEVVGDIVRGEGIFLKFNESKLLNWAASEDVKKRMKELNPDKFQQLLSRSYIENETNAAIYLFIHSLSHALMCSLSGMAGYNIASIRERIYVGEDGLGGNMYGLLIYTSDGDSEGSLGGLVRIGNPNSLSKIFNHALKFSQWCSSDPLCSSSVPKGLGGGVLAACHHCILLPETSCQDKNEFLDRELVISQDKNELGFFK
jgi:hypothetical protein